MFKPVAFTMPVMVTLDNFGRITLPKQIRQKIKSKEFTAEVNGRQLLLTPAPSWEDLAGSLPGLDMKAFKKEHEEGWE